MRAKRSGFVLSRCLSDANGALRMRHRINVLAEQRSARDPVTVEIMGSNPIGDVSEVRGQKSATKLASAEHWRAQVAVTHPLRQWRFDSSSTHFGGQSSEAHSSFGEDAGLSNRLGGFDSRMRHRSARSSNGRIPVSQAGDAGSSPARVNQRSRHRSA